MNSFWEFIGLLFWSYVFVAYLILLFHIFGDLFRDQDLGGFAKALWTIGLIFFPILLALVYLIARGRGMAERQATTMRRAQADSDRYIKSVAGTTSSPASQISSAKSLLDNGSINQSEFEQLKAKALAA